MGMTYMEVQDQLALFYWMRLGSGLFVVYLRVPVRLRSLVPADAKRRPV